MRGRKRKPATLKLLEGNPGKRAIVPEPKPAAGAPACPCWFSEDARAEWDRVVPELDRLNLLTVVDGAAVEGHCLNYSRAVQAERILAELGPTFESMHGPKKRPEATIAAECWRMVRAFLSELGLSPAARARLKPVDDEKADEFEEFLKQA